MNSSSESSTVSIYYSERPGKPTITAHGGYGGAAGNNTSVAMHLWADSPSFPSIDQVAIDPSTGQGTLSQRIRHGEVRREIQATLILTPEAAVEIGNWLAEQGARCLQSRMMAE